MKYIILCGGNGTRLKDHNSFPKPLNYVLGVPMIKYVIERIPSDEVYLILNKNLKEYNIDTILPHLCHKKYNCMYLERLTRGPIESALLGIDYFNFDDNEQICFFDNDTIYNVDNIQFPENAFIGYSEQDNSDERPYCYIRIDNGEVKEIAEKRKISSYYANGIYGFKNVQQFKTLSKDILQNNYLGTEYYMSILYEVMIKNNIKIDSLYIKDTICLGTKYDILNNIEKISRKKLRICFDIDNTLVKYRVKSQTYSTVETIDRMQFLLRKLKSDGHTIILYTARGMKTAHNNIGLSMKNVAKETFENLEMNNIEYDEIYFGKPDADIYVDDKAFNPYMNIFNSMGFYNLNEEYNIQSVLQNSTNKYNYLYKTDQEIIKVGPISSIIGEQYFYNTIKNTSVANLFPKYNWSKVEDQNMKMSLEFISGFTLYELLKDELLTSFHIDKLIENLDKLHNCKDISVNIQASDIYENYMGKLKKRILNRTDYPFDNLNDIISLMDNCIKEYIFSNKLTIGSIVHGDSWFSNILLSDDNKMVFLDMKGDINGILTTNGDTLTDFGKIYQSLLGFDYIVNNYTPNNMDYINNLRQHFLNRMNERNISIKQLNGITACLIAKTVSFLNVKNNIKYSLWNIIQGLLEV